LFGTDGKFFEKSFNEKYMYLLSSSNGSWNIRVTIWFILV
jgi:hypothetical protein